MSRGLQRAAWVLALAAWLGLGAANLLFGELNQDEGWYLYAARLVAEGQFPYVHFAFTQGPMLPLVYGAAHAVIDAFGLAGGRVLTALLGLLAALAAAAVAGRMAGPAGRGPAALLAFSLIAVNVYQSYFTTLVKTYALCGLFLAAGFLLLLEARSRRAALLFALAGLVLAAAAATRITAGLALAAGGVAVLALRREVGDRGWICFGLGGLAGLALFYGTFFAAAPEATRFFVIDYHAARSAGSWASQMVYKVGFVSRLTQAYFVAFLCGGALVLWRILNGAPAPVPRDPLRLAGWATVAGITLVQALAPFPYDDYEVPIFPLFAALLAAALVRRVGEADADGRGRVRALVLAGLLASAAASVSSPLNQAWMIVGRDRIWWRMREQPALLQFREVARRVKALAGDQRELLTQDVYLAVETGLRVPPGLEMGQFSYYPGLSRAEAERYHVVNGEMLRAIIDGTPARVAALSDYALVMASPQVSKLSEAEQQELWDRVRARFRPVAEVADFGQGNTTLRLLTAREPAP